MTMHKLLVVDDDPAVLRLISKITTTAGYRVVQARDGQEALTRILQDCPDMVVTDWEMPGLDGVHLCREIRSRDLPQYVYVLLLTAKSHPREMVEAFDVGVDDFITKPIDKAVLLARLKAGARTVALQHRLRRLGDLDPLTGTLNRRAFRDRMTAEWERATRYSHELSCVMIDIDFFKKFNDTHGHAAGDIVLQSIVATLDRSRRINDILARFGGEEFYVLLPETDEAGAVRWSERARAAIAAMEIPYADKLLKVTASFGVASRTPTTHRPEALLDLVDQALSVSKESGRNQVVPYSALADRGPDSPLHYAAYAPLDRIFARDIMAPAIYCPHDHETVDRVADLFLQLRLNAAPVVDDDNRLIGIISENDLLVTLATNASLAIPIRDCMKTIFVQYEENTPAKEIFQFLSRAYVPRVIVVRDRCPVGVVSRATLLHWLRNWANAHRVTPWIPDAQSNPVGEEGISRIIEMASDRLAKFRRFLAENDTDIIPGAVAEATRMEDFAHDILAHCAGHCRL
jgi:two-component system chemotaxis response regulator CheY